MKFPLYTAFLFLLSSFVGLAAVIVEGEVNKHLDSEALTGKALSSLANECGGFTDFAFYVIVCRESGDFVEEHRFRVRQLEQARAAGFILASTDRIWVCHRPSFEMGSLLPKAWEKRITDSGKIRKRFDYTSLEEPKPAEQAGTRQPATRPESKSEDRNKSQPEAEGRSR